MRKVILVISLASAVVILSTCSKRQEGRCRLKYQAVDTLESTIYLACQNLVKIPKKTAQFKDLPKNKSGRFSYFLAKIADRDIPVVVDRTKKVRLFMDTNGDGYLSDEKRYISKAVKKRLFGSVEHYKFGPILVKFDRPDGKYTRRIYIITRNNLDYRYICPADYRKGKVLLGQNIYDVAVVDGDFDGKYDKILSPPVKNFLRPGCDSFAIDLNRDGKLDFNYYFHSEIMPLAKMVKVGNSYYRINIDESGNSLELDKIQPEFGILDLGIADVTIKLWSNAAEQYISSFKNNELIPAGKYQALFIEGSKIDSERNTWTFTCLRDTGTLRDFEIIKNVTTSFKIGPPFQIKTTARQNRNTVSIGFNLLGQGQEEYRHDVKRNGRRVSAPIFRIFDEVGKLLESGRFEYG
ncbi:MAG: hypothetical protein H8D56_02605 [Planctomycetes bacterium]|nr:hypothetical protein [Planctomycetota bacterium]MBL7146612.1 hypothetical protein [Phycisphaerae bacterium]